MSEPDQPGRVFDVAADPEQAFDAAAEAIAAGEVIVLPTDTVYGVGADPLSPAAVQRLLDAKRRGRDMPPPILVAEVEMVKSLAEVSLRVEILAREFWPGPLTLVLKAHDSLRMDLGDRGETIAVRVPDHEFTRELLRRTGPLAVSSANVSGSEAALTIEEAEEQLGDNVAVYLDAGEMSGPVPSTIVDMTGPIARLLRAGRIGIADLNQAVPALIDPDAEPVVAPKPAVEPAPGPLDDGPQDEPAEAEPQDEPAEAEPARSTELADEVEPADPGD